MQNLCFYNTITTPVALLAMLLTNTFIGTHNLQDKEILASSIFLCRNKNAQSILILGSSGNCLMRGNNFAGNQKTVTLRAWSNCNHELLRYILVQPLLYALYCNFRNLTKNKTKLSDIYRSSPEIQVFLLPTKKKEKKNRQNCKVTQIHGYTSSGRPCPRLSVNRDNQETRQFPVSY